jgi:hypothetical protein
MTQASGCTPAFCIGIDIGFGDVKAVAAGPNGSGGLKLKTLKFPSNVAKAGRTRIRGLDNALSRYTYQGRDWLVGTEAVASERAVVRRDASFLLDFVPLFIFKIMEKLATEYRMSLSAMLHAPKKMGVGLPLEYFADHRQTILDSLESFAVSGQVVEIKNETKVFAQGQGVQFDFLIANGKINRTWNNKTMAILDVGFNTIDFLAINEGCADPENSEMITQKGVCRICTELRRELKQRDLEMSEYGIKKALYDKQTIFFGQTVDLNAVVSQLAEEYAEELFTEVSTRFGAFLPKSEKLVLAGGGSYFVREQFVKRYSKTFVHVPPKAEFSNARGYMKFLELSA